MSGPDSAGQLLPLPTTRAVAQRAYHFLSFSCRLSSLQVGGQSAWTTEGTEAASFFQTQRWLHEDLFIKLLFAIPGSPRPAHGLPALPGTSRASMDFQMWAWRSPGSPPQSDNGHTAAS